MNYTVTLTVFLFVIAYLLILYKPSSRIPMAVEGFAVTAVPGMPACVERSKAAQSLLERLKAVPHPNDDADELRLLVSKLCCLEADIATPAAGSYRTYPLQFRTSHDMEPASTTVGRCMRNALVKRDIDLIIEKFEKRGKELVGRLLVCPEAPGEFEEVLTRTKLAMTNFCMGNQPSMDHPLGVRDMGFWESAQVAGLSGYKGFGTFAVVE